MAVNSVTPAQQEEIAGLYAAFWNRAPDTTGFGFWVNKLASGEMTIDEIATAFRNAPEGIAAYPEWSTNEQLVTEVYNNVFGRAPDPVGLAFWTQALNQGRATFPELVIDMIIAAETNGSADGALFTNKVDVGVYVATVAQTDNGYVTTNAFNYVTADPASVATAEAWVDANNTGATYTLTTNIDTINVDGHAVNTVIGVENSSATGTTWNTGDTINGNNLTKVNLVENGGTGNIVDINNVASLNVNLAATSTLNATEFTNVAQIGITNGTVGTRLTVSNDDLSSTHAISVARAVTMDIESVATGSADEAILAANGAGLKATAGNRAAFDVSGGNAVEAVTLATTGKNFVDIVGGSTTATIEITGAGENNTLISNAAAVMTVDASSTTGKNTVDVGTLLSTGDTVLGGSGANDSVQATLNAALPISATVSGFETLDLAFTANATYNASKTTGATALHLTPTGSITSNVTNLGASVQTISYGKDAAISAASSNTTVSYASGSNSDVDLLIGATPSSGTAAVSIGSVTLSGNKGGLSVESNGTATNTIAGLTANSVTALGVAGVAQALTVGNISATAAASVDVDGSLKNTRTGKITVDESTSEINISSDAGTAIVSDASGATALVDGDGIVLTSSAADSDIAVTLNIGSGAKSVTVGTVGITGNGKAGSDVNATVNVESGVGAISTGVMTFTGGAAATDAVTVNVDVAANDGNVTIAGITLNEASSTKATNEANVVLAAAGGNVTLTALDLVNITETNLFVSAAADDTLTITNILDTGAGGDGVLASITAEGAGTISLGAGASAGTDVVGDTVVDATATTGDFTLDLAAVASANDITVYLGNAASTKTNTVLTGGGADTIFGGSGVDDINGGSGNDFIEGRAGNDLLTGDVGADIISGGTGIDAFLGYANATSAASVAANTTVTGDNLTDFTTAVDTIQLDSAGTTGAGTLVNFAADATATVTQVALANVASFNALIAAMGTLTASTTSVAQVYNVILTGTGLAAAGVNHLLVVNGSGTAYDASDVLIQLSGTSTASVVAGDFTFI